MKILKIAGLMFGSIFLIVTCCALALYLVPDEELKPEAAQSILPNARLAPQQNLYNAIVGFEIASGRIDAQLGYSIVTEANSILGNRPIILSEETQNKLEHIWPDSPGLVELDAICAPRREGCLQSWWDDFAQHRELLADYKFASDAFAKLFQFKDYQNELGPQANVWLLSYTWQTQGHRLFLLSIFADYYRGHYSDGAKKLNSLIQFDRNFLAKANTLIDKMVAVAMLSDLANVYGAILEFTSSPLHQVPELNPLNAEERSMKLPLHAEYVFGVKIVMQSLNDPARTWFDKIVSGYFLKINLGLNNMYHCNEIALKRDDLAPHELLSPPDNMACETSFMEWLFNPLATYWKLTRPTLDSYILRSYDLDGMIMLVALKKKLLRENVQLDQMSAFLSNHAQEFQDPYTHGPVSWDPEHGILSIASSEPRFGYNQVKLKHNFK